MAQRLRPGRRAGGQGGWTRHAAPAVRAQVGMAGSALTSVQEGIAPDKARALIESRISFAVPTLNKFTQGHGYLIF